MKTSNSPAATGAGSDPVGAGPAVGAGFGAAGQASSLSDALDLAHADLTRYVRFNSAEAADAVTLWVAASHSQSLWEHATRLVVKSPVKRCGKTRLQEVVRELVHRPLVAGSISAAALVRSISEDDPPTLILDEADVVFGKKDSDQAADLKAILNLGHSRGWPYIRWNVKKAETEECPTFAMALIAGIGDMPDTVEDRAVVITMQRRAPGEVVSEFRRRHIHDLHTTRTILQHAVIGSFSGDRELNTPDIPVEDRAADVWEPLVTIADFAGGEWPQRGRAACLALSGDEEEEQTLGQRLLADLSIVWRDDEEHLATVAILERLHDLDESPWPDYFGRPLNPRDLSRLLRPYQVRPKTVRIPNSPSTCRGYSRADLYPTWSRYTSQPEDPTQPTQAPPPPSSDTSPPSLTRDVSDVSDLLPDSEHGSFDTATTNLIEAGISLAEERRGRPTQ